MAENRTLLDAVASARATVARAQADIAVLERQLASLNASETSANAILQTFSRLEQDLEATKYYPLPPGCASTRASLLNELSGLKRLAQTDLIEFEAALVLSRMLLKKHPLISLAGYFVDVKTLADAAFKISDATMGDLLECQSTPGEST